MIILTIGEISRRLSSSTPIDESWLTLLMRRPSANASRPGVHVRIAAPSVALNLSAGEKCAAVLTKGLCSLELLILDLWQQRGLEGPEFRSGQLVAFLHQVQDVLEQDSAGGSALLTQPDAWTAGVT